MHNSGSCDPHRRAGVRVGRGVGGGAAGCRLQRALPPSAPSSSSSSSPPPSPRRPAAAEPRVRAGAALSGRRISPAPGPRRPPAGGSRLPMSAAAPPPAGRGAAVHRQCTVGIQRRDGPAVLYGDVVGAGDLGRDDKGSAAVAELFCEGFVGSKCVWTRRGRVEHGRLVYRDSAGRALCSRRAAECDHAPVRRVARHGSDRTRVARGQFQPRARALRGSDRLGVGYRDAVAGRYDR